MTIVLYVLAAIGAACIAATAAFLGFVLLTTPRPGARVEYDEPAWASTVRDEIADLPEVTR